ncbi:efflux transporter outer membrane subunit [Halomonas sp. JS92-SW72]|uniref:efflux transporter outer membrane subunit n=1 Tax=Halomonas sp. JS92-SW72 TaxID=2306583 RepID=UPI001F09D67F|nr:efflux transporter outer membrane subunit [Halomonas sp. JS92-SW72]
MTMPPRTTSSYPTLMVIALATMTLSGCATLPPSGISGEPALDVPTHWSFTAPDGQGVVVGNWWHSFGDPTLNALVDAALDANPDLAIAVARLAQARALRSGVRAERRPKIDAVAGAERGRNSSAEPKTERTAVGLRATWEVDLFDRTTLAMRAAEDDAEGALQALQAARISLAADVSTAYLELRTLAQRLTLQREAIHIAQRQIEVSQHKLAAGHATSSDVEHRRRELAEKQATMTQLNGEYQMQLHRLSLLLGDGQVPQLENLHLPIASPAPPSLLLPVELLERRPDVLHQAHALDAALVRAGMARREVYPSLQIAWQRGKERIAQAGGSAAPQLVIGYGLSISLPLLDGGRIRTNIAIREAQVQEAMAVYEKALLEALIDAETALTQWSMADESLLERQRAESAAAIAARNATSLYEAGMADLELVLAAQLSHLHTRDALAQAIGSHGVAAIGLRRAFAGEI